MWANTSALSITCFAAVSPRSSIQRKLNETELNKPAKANIRYPSPHTVTESLLENCSKFPQMCIVNSHPDWHAVNNHKLLCTHPVGGNYCKKPISYSQYSVGARRAGGQLSAVSIENYYHRENKSSYYMCCGLLYQNILWASDKYDALVEVLGLLDQLSFRNKFIKFCGNLCFD